MSGLENKIVYGEGFKLQTSSARSISDMQRTASDVSRINYVGNPEGVISANPSSLCHNPTTGDLYKKDSGTGNTGWSLIGGAPAATIMSVGMRLAQSLAQNAVVDVIYDEIIADTASGYDVLTGKYTIPSTGVYQMLVASNMVSTAGFINCDVFIKDTAQFIYHGTSTAIVSDPNRTVMNSHIVWPFNAGDTVQIQAFAQTVGGTAFTADAFGNGFYNTFSVLKLS